jgi:hypothetical protein
MSFTPGFAPDAKSQWHELDFEFQELVLDELDKLAANLPIAVRGVIEHDFVHRREDERHYIFLRLTVDRSLRTLKISTGN